MDNYSNIFNTEPKFNCPVCNAELHTDWVDNGFGAFSIQASPYICESCGWSEKGCDRCIKDRCFSWEKCHGKALVVKNDHMNHKHLLEEFLNEELEDYSYFTIEIIELEDTNEKSNTEFYSVKITGGSNTQYVSFRLDGKTIEVELGEDSWYEVCSCDYTIKYFWMALLKWE